jgi:hypothetical protein
MAQLGEKPHGFKDLDFLMVLKKAAVVLGARGVHEMRSGGCIRGFRAEI